jgi:hypothetical protein
MKKLTFILLLFSSLFAVSQIDQRIVSPGSAFTNENWPLNTDWGYTRCSSIYLASEINHTGGDIVEIMLASQGTTPDSIPVKIYMMTHAFNTYSGDWTWNGIITHPLIECVFDGKVSFNGGFCKIRLDTPVAYNGTDNLTVAWEVNWGGTGLATPPTFTNKDVTLASRRTLIWSSNTTPPTGTTVGAIYDHIPVLVLNILNPTGDPVTLNSAYSRCGYDSLKWTNNAANDSVVIVASYSGILPYLMNDYTVTVGSPINAMYPLDTVIFKGKASNFVYDHSFDNLKYRKYYFWHFTAAKKYSLSKNSATWGASMGVINEDFSVSTELPDGWTNTNDFIVMPSHGATGNGASVNLNASEMFAVLYSSNFCGAVSDSYLRFKYRYVNKTDYPSTGTAPANIGSLTISVDNGTTNNIHTITPSNHIQSSSFATIDLPIGTYVNGMPIKITFGAIWGTGDYYLDIDDVEIYQLSGIEDIQQSQILLFPNPVSDELHISAPEMNSSNQIIRIMSITGELVYEIESAGATEVIVDVRSLSSGLYVVTVQSGSEMNYSKFIKM